MVLVALEAEFRLQFMMKLAVIHLVQQVVRRMNVRWPVCGLEPLAVSARSGSSFEPWRCAAAAPESIRP